MHYRAHLYRFSAFWLRSKCSICSYQLNIWYASHWEASILNWCLDRGRVLGACSTSAMGWPSIAVPLGSAHLPWGRNLLYFDRFSAIWAKITNYGFGKPIGLSDVGIQSSWRPAAVAPASWGRAPSNGIQVIKITNPYNYIIQEARLFFLENSTCIYIYMVYLEWGFMVKWRSLSKNRPLVYGRLVTFPVHRWY